MGAALLLLPSLAVSASGEAGEARGEASPLLELFLSDLGMLSNENRFDEGIEHWRQLFADDAVMEMNDRVWTGRAELDAYLNMHESVFRRVQYDLVGEAIATATDEHRILSATLQATYVPRDAFGCSSMLRWLGVFWYGKDTHVLHRAVWTSPTSLREWEEQLKCGWLLPKARLRGRMHALMDGVYRDATVEAMVDDFYEEHAELRVNDAGFAVYEGKPQILEWYRGWQALASSVLNVLDEVDIIGNTVMIRVASTSSHNSGACSSTYRWYGLYRFNGHGRIVTEDRFYDAQQMERAVDLLSNCGDLSPRKLKGEL